MAVNELADELSLVWTLTDYVAVILEKMV